MKYVISVVVLCVLMSHISNIVKVNGLDPVCKWFRRVPGKCGPDGNNKCHGQIKSTHKFERCDCTDQIYLNKDHHDCYCFVKPPCRPN
ncbi:hypothetical protein Bca4012_009154 [Brassica carinata]